MGEKIKVYDLAGELNIRSIELVERLNDIGIEVKSHMSSITEEEAEKARSEFSLKKEKSVTQKKSSVRRKTGTSKKDETKIAENIEESKKASGVTRTVVRRRKKTETEEVSVKEVQGDSGKKEKEEIDAAGKKVEEAHVDETKSERSEKEEIVQDGVSATVPVADPNKQSVSLGVVKKKEHDYDDDSHKKDKKKPKVKRDVVKLEVIDVQDMRKRTSRGKYGAKRKAPAGKEQKKTLITTRKASKRKIKLNNETITVYDLAKEMSIKASALIKKLFAMGSMVTINDVIDIETATLVAGEFSYEVEFVGFEEESVITSEDDKEEDLVLRSPVVTMMGHVDHGKTSILDYIRKSRIADKEAGGITQHIGAYEVKLDKGVITFIDTPGHAAFTEMRARGSQVTDIVILVIAADDGVMPQTRESVSHAKAAGVEIIVAINKVDKPEANIDMVKNQLSELELISEDWGGQTIFVNTSAKTGEGIDELLESILLQSEVMELRANPNKAGQGIVVESRLDKGLGPVATVVTQSGTLKIGDYIVAGICYGKIRSLRSPLGERIDTLAPGRAGEILGLNNVPSAGDHFNCVASDSDARKLVQHRLDEKRRAESGETKKGYSLDDLMQSISTGERKELKLVVKADTHGSVEALRASLEKISDENVTVNVIYSSTGAVTVNDVNLALASEAIIIAFNVRPDSKAQAEAEKLGVILKFYSIIYQCLEDIEKLKIGMLEPVEREKVNGIAEVRQLFSVPKIGVIAGCGVKNGKIVRNSQVRIIREGVVIYTGGLSSLRHFKDDVKEVDSGKECGIGVEGFNDIKIGDSIESFSVEFVDALEAAR